MPSTLLKLSLSARRITAIVLAASASLLLTAAAVTQLPSNSRGQRYPVQGRLLVAGQPAAGAEICFYEMSAEGESAPVARAWPDADGSFEVFGRLAQRGVSPGEYAVTVTWHAPVISGEDYLPGHNIVPSRYAAPHTTPLKVQVDRQDNRLPPWSLSARDCGG